MGFFLSRSKLSVQLYAAGGNPRAATLPGIPVSRITILADTASGLFGGIAGFLFLARTGSVPAHSGGNLLLETIAAIVIGGVSLAGGKGTVLSAFAGTLLLVGLSNLTNIPFVSPHLQDAVSGLIIVAAIVINTRLDPSRQHL
ncbi:MAG: hypothetical protein NTV73_06975 [Hyphomicrobiales bacterium]|nr:hypothetical protein [Hyphomicrobiales bacterium]